MVINMKAINNNVILERISSDTTSMGIILNTVSNNTGKVIEKDETLENINKGNVVIFKEENAIKFENNGKKYLVVNIKDILVILD